MPKYRFECQKCNEEFCEIWPYPFERVATGDIYRECSPCPLCGSDDVIKLLSRGVSTHYSAGGYTKTPKRTKTKDKVKEREDMSRNEDLSSAKRDAKKAAKKIINKGE